MWRTAHFGDSTGKSKGEKKDAELDDLLARAQELKEQEKEEDDTKEEESDQRARAPATCCGARWLGRRPPPCGDPDGSAACAALAIASVACMSFGCLRCLGV